MGIDRAVARRAQATAGPGPAERGRRAVQRGAGRAPTSKANDPRVAVEGESFDFGNGDVAIAAITSCTNTSNPSVLVAAGLVARKAREKGLHRQAVGQDQPRAGQPGGHRLSQRKRPQRGPQRARLRPRRLWLHDLHRQFGPAAPSRSRKAINDNDLVAVSVLSGNRNFEGRVSPDCRANYLASPPLVVAYALKGTVRSDMVKEPIGTASNGEPVYLKDIWPTNEEIRALDRRARSFGDVPPPLRRRLSRRRALAEDRGQGRRDLRLAGRLRPTSRTRPTSPA